MKELITKKLQEIEKEKGIKILFAVENGSRAWRMESVNSDYDVRFVYYRPVEEYIQIDLKGDVIDCHFDKEGNRVAPEGCFIDMIGFDMFKFVRMLWSSNPQAVEWLSSDIVYYGEQNEVFKKFAEQNFKPISLYFHYKSMCKQNYLKYLKGGALVTYKKYLYAMRGLVNAKWVSTMNTLPPINFTETLDLMSHDNNHFSNVIEERIIKRLREIIELKKEGREKDIIQNIVCIDNYIESFLKDDSDAPGNKQTATPTELNREMRRLILGEILENCVTYCRICDDTYSGSEEAHKESDTHCMYCNMLKARDKVDNNEKDNS